MNRYCNWIIFPFLCFFLFSAQGLIIEEPPELRGLMLSTTTYLFGNYPPPPPGYFNKTLVYMNATDGCTTPINSDEIAGNIALVDRGNCYFIIKVKMAQDAGALAVVVVNNHDPTTTDGADTFMSGTDPTITIPR
jgi:hypothetical protein